MRRRNGAPVMLLMSLTLVVAAATCADTRAPRSIFQSGTGWMVIIHHASDDRLPDAAIDDAEALGSDLHGCIPEFGI